MLVPIFPACCFDLFFDSFFVVFFFFLSLRDQSGASDLFASSCAVGYLHCEKKNQRGRGSLVDC